MPWTAPSQGHAAVATAHPLATAAAAAALAAGGSAVDALVTASLVLTVATPQSTGIGGGGFAVVVPPRKPAVAFDFREAAPAATRLADYLDGDGRAIAERSRHHGLAVATPGYIAGLHTLHQRWGKLPWPVLVEPARRAAAEGIAVSPQLARAIALMWPHLDPVARDVFGRDGQPLQPGARLQWPALASTLAQIAVDPLAMHHGAIAADIAETVAAHGGKLAVADLATYRVLEVAPLAGTLAGRQAWTMPAPSAGGAQVLAMAEWLQGWRADPALAGGTSVGEGDVAAEAHALVEAMRRSFLLRLRHPASEPRATLDAVYPAAERRLLATHFDPRHATATATLQAWLDGLSGAPPESHANTSHVAIVDADGLAVSSTHTVNLLLGSGIVTRRTGILLNNEMDDFSMSVRDSNAFGLAGSAHHLARPLARPVSSMSPIVVMQGPPEAPGGVMLVAGSPGGTRIPTTVLQIVDRSLRGWPLDRAVAAPRVHHQALADVAWVEEGPAGDAVALALQAAGHSVQRQSPWCNVQAITAVSTSDGQWRWHAVADPRGEGSAFAN